MLGQLPTPGDYYRVTLDYLRRARAARQGQGLAGQEDRRRRKRRPFTMVDESRTPSATRFTQPTSPPPPPPPPTTGGDGGTYVPGFNPGGPIGPTPPGSVGTTPPGAGPGDFFQQDFNGATPILPVPESIRMPQSLSGVYTPPPPPPPVPPLIATLPSIVVDAVASTNPNVAFMPGDLSGLGDVDGVGVASATEIIVGSLSTATPEEQKGESNATKARNTAQSDDFQNNYIDPPWSPTRGTWVEDTDALYLTVRGTAGKVPRSLITYAARTYTDLLATSKLPSAYTGGVPGEIYFRYTIDGSDMLSGYRLTYAAGALKIQPVNAEVPGADIASFVTALVAGDIIGIRATGTTLEIMLNGASVASGVDATYTGGSLGLAAALNIDMGCDRFSVTPLA